MCSFAPSMPIACLMLSWTSTGSLRARQILTRLVGCHVRNLSSGVFEFRRLHDPISIGPLCVELIGLIAERIGIPHGVEVPPWRMSEVRHCAFGSGKRLMPHHALLRLFFSI